MLLEVADAAPQITRDQPTVTCLRSVLMKPEHQEWLGRIWTLLDDSTRAAQA